MADENNSENAETAPAAEVAPPKKRRGPRPKNVVSGATAETSEADAAQTVRGRRKRPDKSAKGQAASRTKAKNIAKGTEAPRINAPPESSGRGGVGSSCRDVVLRADRQLATRRMAPGTSGERWVSVLTRR